MRISHELNLMEERMKILRVVDKINEKLGEKLDESEQMIISVCFALRFAFFSVSIPDSSQEIKLEDCADDDRKYYEETDSYEDYEEYICRRYEEQLEKMHPSIKQLLNER